MKIVIQTETPDDYREVEILTREAFWNVYKPGCDEHCVLHCFRERDNFIKELSLVLKLDDKIIAHIMYAVTQIRCDDGTVLPIAVFGPVSVLPRFQRQGYGSKLIAYSLQKAKMLGYGAIAITGNPDYYSRFGFISGPEMGIYYEGIPRTEPTPFFMVKELKDGYLQGISGTYSDPDGYSVSSECVSVFDAQFEPKEKLKLPGQIFGQ